MKTLLLALLLVALPGMVWSQTVGGSLGPWYKGADGPDNSPAGNTISAVRPGNVAFFDLNTATADSNSVGLDISACGSISFDFNEDEDGTTAGATVYLRQSAERQTEVTCDVAGNSVIVSVDVNGDGTVTSADEQTLTGAIGRRGFSGLKVGQPYVCVDVVANAGFIDARATLTCHP